MPKRPVGIMAAMTNAKDQSAAPAAAGAAAPAPASAPEPPSDHFGGRHRSTPLEDYALLSDLQTGPLVSRDGSVDWMCLPRFDSPSVFASILGTPDNGRWKLSIRGGSVTQRRYVPKTFILETYWECPTGRAVVRDFLPPSSVQGDLIRSVECLEGEVTVTHDLRVRFAYARALPWFRQGEVEDTGERVLLCTAGPDGLMISGPMLYDTTEPEDSELEAHSGGSVAPRLVGDFSLRQGDTLDWSLTWFPSWQSVPTPVNAADALELTTEFWQHWLSNLEVDSPWAGLVRRSLLVLRALTHSDTGGIVAAPTASLPEDFGGERNWDYRYTWLRDAALTVEVMVSHGFVQGATDWRDWLLRAVAGDVENLQIMYGLGGERELPERELPHLIGYEHSRPVRVGNGAAAQYQADVVGEVMLALAKLRDAGLAEDQFSWGLQKQLLEYTVANIHRRDHGIWEMRGKLHYFTHGRVMMWAALNEGIRAVEEYGLDGDVESWRYYRDSLRSEIMQRGFNAKLNSFTQAYENTEVDASLLQLPHTGFLPPDAPEMLGTVKRIEQELVDDHGFVYRYRTEGGIDGLSGDEAPFLICTFWLIEQYAASGRLDDAIERMNVLAGIASDLGLLAEEYDPERRRMAGNFPQAFSHLALIRAADAIAHAQHKQQT